MVEADKIIGVDINPAKADMARRFGMTHFANPRERPARTTRPFQR